MGNRSSLCCTEGPDDAGDLINTSASNDELFAKNISESDRNVSLFTKIGVLPLSRPDFATLREVWMKYDEDQNDVMVYERSREFLMFVSKVWGDESYPPADNEGDSVVSTLSNDTDHVWLSIKKKNDFEISWEEIFLAFWHEPVCGIPSHVAVMFQHNFHQVLRISDKSENEDELATIDAVSLAHELLRSIKAPEETSKDVLNTLVKFGVSIDFETYLSLVGRAYADNMPDDNKSLTDIYDDGEMPTDFGGTIYSFAPVRDSNQKSSYEILICGESIFFEMFATIKQAQSEICMSWWLFCPTLPIFRGAAGVNSHGWGDDKLGNNAWNNEHGLLTEVLKEKSAEGVKVYIILYDIINIAPLAPIVDHSIQILQELNHENIHVVKHPGLNVWTHSHHQKFVVVDRTAAVLGSIDWAPGRWDTPAHPLFDPDSEFHPGIELSRNAFHLKSDISDWWMCPEKDIVKNRSEVVAKPWQDVALSIRGPAAGDLFLNFKQRWQWIKRERMDLVADLFVRMVDIPDGLRKVEFDTKVWDSEVAGIKLSDLKTSLGVGGYPSSNASTNCKCQIVRSLGNWSGGLTFAETSYYEAWISVINSAENYIYIEQQYFISNVGQSSSCNRVTDAILNRVQDAIECNRFFRIYVVVPIDVGSTITQYYTRKTLIQDHVHEGETQKCLMSRIQDLLEKAKPGTRWYGRKPESMLSVSTLTVVGQSPSGRWDMGHVFVNSKVLLVDDKVAIIGSANLNDRSFVGFSDSEIGAVLWDENKDEKKIGSLKEFRLRLWRQHLGLSKKRC
uniref:phospholipase D n=1 Tax=Corethron hystrix TaxID=216773 RepID=A0A7S1FMT2_9STRA|mmetsp:Transcript_13665/g.30143  ORF Transcript_13665/g.30143 Transcript_13665/m.30143 type:complete len:790 (+) Transcript_13665:55-2424(+)